MRYFDLNLIHFFNVMLNQVEIGAEIIDVIAINENREIEADSFARS